MINFVVNHPTVGDYDLSSLRALLFGASPMPTDRILAAREIFGPILAQAYGMTETAPLLCAQRIEWLDYDTPEGVERLASCGRQVQGVAVRVVDENDVAVPAGGTGEIVARGPNVMLGYWNRPEETAEALRGGWMHTGDVARIDEQGFIYIVDRSKDMIVSGGENVFTTETEGALYQHPAVLEAAVFGIPDDRWGEAVHAAIVPARGRGRHRGRPRRALPRAHRRLQVPQERRVPRHAPAQVRRGEDPQDEPARPLVGGLRAGRQLASGSVESGFSPIR